MISLGLTKIHMPKIGFEPFGTGIVHNSQAVLSLSPWSTIKESIPSDKSLLGYYKYGAIVKICKFIDFAKKINTNFLADGILGLPTPLSFLLCNYF